MDILADTKPENYFVTKDGQKLRNLHHLHKALINMKDDVFNHHVNGQRNDFYNWIKDIYQDANLSSSVLNCKTKLELSQKLKQSLDEAIKKKKTGNSIIIKPEITETKKEQNIKPASDVRNIIAEAKKEVEQKVKLLEVMEKPIQIQQKEPVKEIQPKTEKQVFVEKPPRIFTKEEKAIRISPATYMRMSAVDLVFGVIICVIIVLIVKQLF